jgi:hypothetical protein
VTETVYPAPPKPTEGSCCFGIASCSQKASHPQNCPQVAGCETEASCLGACSSKQKARWCPDTPGPPPPPFVPSIENITVFRITPQNYSGVTNMNTGDAAGDVFFGLYERAIPILCANQAMHKMITCANVPILSIPNFNVYQQSILELDTRYGEYNECNPDPSSGIFACETRAAAGGVPPPPQCSAYQVTDGYCFNGSPPSTHRGSLADCCSFAASQNAPLWTFFSSNNSCEIHTDHGAEPCAAGTSGSPPQGNKCWYDSPHLAWEFASVCSRSECQCDAVTKRSVGREFIKDTMGSMGGGSASPTCVAVVESACGSDKNDQAMCQACLETNGAKLIAACNSSQSQFQAAAIDVCYGGGSAGGMGIFQLISPLANILNGTWYRYAHIYLIPGSIYS